MTLPPQGEGVTLRCDLEAGHWPGTLHCAPDPDGVIRRWPSDGSDAAIAAGVLDVGTPAQVPRRGPEPVA